MAKAKREQKRPDRKRNPSLRDTEKESELTADLGSWTAYAQSIRASKPARKPLVPVERHLRTFLKEVGVYGLDATLALELSESYGFKLHRSSVSSILSRMKAKGELLYDGKKYRLLQYEPKPGSGGLLDPEAVELAESPEPFHGGTLMRRRVRLKKEYLPGGREFRLPIVGGAY